MNRREWVAAAARRTSLTQRQTGEALDALLDTLTHSLSAGGAVTVSSFGRFDLQRYPGRRLRRFDGPGHYRVEERWVPTFKSSAALRRRIRSKHESRKEPS